jgi:hypothetical protein
MFTALGRSMESQLHPKSDIYDRMMNRHGNYALMALTFKPFEAFNRT